VCGFYQSMLIFTCINLNGDLVYKSVLQVKSVPIQILRPIDTLVFILNGFRQIYLRKPKGKIYIF